MNQEIKASGFSKSYVVNNLKCNHMSIGTFVANYGSEAMQRMIPQNTKVNVIDIAANSGFNGQLVAK